MRLSACLPVCLSACLMSVSVALADEVAPTSLDMEGWTSTPLHDAGVVRRLLMLRNPDQLPAGVIGLLADRQVDGSWSIGAWTTASYEEIVLYLAGQTGQSPDEVVDGLADLPLDWVLLEDPAVVGVAPEPFGSGLVSGDPLEPAVEGAGDPLALLEVLEFLGYPAVAKIGAGTPPVGGSTPIDPSPHPDDCIQLSAGAWFDMLAESFEAEIAVPETGFGVFDDLWDAAQQCCWPRTWVSAQSSSPWVCGAWSLDSTPTPNHLGQCVFDYFRIATRSQSRTLRHRYLNCSVAVCTQTRSCSAYQWDTCVAQAYPTMPPGGTCVGVSCPPQSGVSCAPTNTSLGGQACTPWFPECQW